MRGDGGAIIRQITEVHPSSVASGDTFSHRGRRGFTAA
jgi:hypothetical protein